jgi:hypothetical protein
MISERARREKSFSPVRKPRFRNPVSGGLPVGNFWVTGRELFVRMARGVLGCADLKEVLRCSLIVRSAAGNSATTGGAIEVAGRVDECRAERWFPQNGPFG